MEELSKIDSGNSHENVIEYGNIYSIGRIGLSYPPEYNQVIRFIKNARLLYPIDRMKQRKWLEERIRISYWPYQDERLACNRIKFGSNRTESVMVSKGVYAKTIVTISNCCRVEVKAFPDSHGRWFYWWDRYLNDNIASGIEIFPWVDARDTYVLFATDSRQPPLLCTGPFLNANIRKGIFHY